MMLLLRTFSWSLLLVFCLSLFSLANAQDLDCLSKPADHPCWGGIAPSFSSDAVGLAEAVDEINQRRMAEGDCTGLDHEGCLGVQAAKVYCWLVGCLTPPDEPAPEDPDPNDPPEDPDPDDPPEDPDPGDPPADPGDPEPDDPKAEPHGDTAAEFVGMQSQRFSKKTRKLLGKLEQGSLVTRFSWENATELEVVLVRFFETKKNNKRGFLAFLDIVDLSTSEKHRIVIGGQGNIVFTVPLETYLKAEIRNKD